MVSCRLNVSWVLPSYFTSSCMSHLGCRDSLPEDNFLLHIRTGLGCCVATNICDRDRRQRGTRWTGSPQPLKTTRRQMGPQDEASGTLAAPVPAAKRITLRHGEETKDKFCILHRTNFGNYKDPKQQEGHLEPPTRRCMTSTRRRCSGVCHLRTSWRKLGG